MRVERRESRGEAAGGWAGCSGSGRDCVEEEVSKGTASLEVTVQPAGVISTNWPAGLARSRRILWGVGEAPRESMRQGTRMLQFWGSRAAWASRWWRMALKAWAVGMVSNSLKAWSKNHWRKERERMAKVRKPEDGAGTVMKARPSTPVKGTPRRAMGRKAWKPEGPWGLGGVRVGTLQFEV